jgi:hypothetical protein
VKLLPYLTHLSRDDLRSLSPGPVFLMNTHGSKVGDFPVQPLHVVMTNAQKQHPARILHGCEYSYCVLGYDIVYSGLI